MLIFHYFEVSCLIKLSMFLFNVIHSIFIIKSFFISSVFIYGEKVFVYSHENNFKNINYSSLNRCCALLTVSSSCFMIQNILREN